MYIIEDYMCHYVVADVRASLLCVLVDGFASDIDTPTSTYRRPVEWGLRECMLVRSSAVRLLPFALL